MEYRIEKVLPIVERLADRYTARESSSVAYKTAGMLMEAALYCIKEGEGAFGNGVMADRLPDENMLYEQGLRQVMENVYEAKGIYEKLLLSFEDYGCIHYRDTILKGMPEFFVRYDPVFTPMDHLLTLDYPLLCGNPPLNGSRLILEYLRGITLEADFLGFFDPGEICGLLMGISPEYEELYPGNICEQVLLAASAGVIADMAAEGRRGRRENTLELTAEDVHRIGLFFRGKSREEIRLDMEKAISRVIEATIGAVRAASGDNVSCRLRGVQTYFLRAAGDYGTVIWNGIRQDCLEGVFCVEG